MAIDMRALIEAANGPLPPRHERYRVGELIAFCRAQAPALEAAAWGLALDHERRAMEVATLESGALAALAGARRAGFATALWTNNARAPRGPGAPTRLARGPRQRAALAWSSSESPSEPRPPRGRQRRWPTGCDRARSTRSWGRSICWGPAGSFGPRSRRTSCTR